MSRKLLTTVALMIFVAQSWAQIEISDELKRQLNGKNRLYDVMRTVEAYYADYKKEFTDHESEDESESALLHWKRWEHYMRNRVGANGEFVDMTQNILDAFNQITIQSNAQARSTTSASWNVVGPINMLYKGGSYRGLGRVECIEFHPTNPNIIYVGTPAGGVWKTVDGGLNWTCISNALPSCGISSIAVSRVDPNIIYIATGIPNGGSFYGEYNRTSSIGVWKTINGGASWYPTGYISRNPLRKLIIDPLSSDIVYVAGHTGIFKTVNGGNSWENKNYSQNFWDIEFSTGSKKVIFAANFEQVFKSTDSGENWTVSTTINGRNTIDRIELSVAPTDSNIVYALVSGVPAAGQFKGLYKSTNNGNSFSNVANTPNIYGISLNGLDGFNQSTYDLAIAVSSLGAHVLVTGGTTVWRSINGGGTLQAVTTYSETPNLSVYIHPDIMYLAYNPLNNNLYAATDGGFYRSTNDGGNWTDLSNGIATTMFYSLAGFDANSARLAGGAQDNGIKMKHSVNDFEHIIGGDGFDVVYDPNNGTRIYATGNDNFYRFSNDGTNDVFQKVSGDYFPIIESNPVSSGNLYLAYRDSFFKSTDAGLTWSQKRVNLETGNRAICAAPSNSNRLYLTNGNSIWRSDDAAENWTNDLLDAVDLGGMTISDLKVCPSNANIVWFTVGGNDATRKVFYSTNSGADWTNLTGTLPNVPVHSIAVDYSNNAYVGTEVGVYYQSATSINWTPYSNGLPKIPISELIINQNNSKIRAATYGRGVWETDLFTSCEANATLSNTAGSNSFYEVSGTLTSVQTIAPGATSNVVLRAGSEVILSNGFNAAPGSVMMNDTTKRNFFTALIGPCETDYVFRDNSAKENPIPVFARRIKIESTDTNFPFGSLIVEKNNGFGVALNVFKAGIYTLEIMDRGGNLIKSISNANNLTVGVHRFPENWIKYKNKGLYIVLYNSEGVVHYQQLD
jgi:photosystem II stability/assembly factor-like uncharacterized protein